MAMDLPPTGLVWRWLSLSRLLYHIRIGRSSGFKWWHFGLYADTLMMKQNGCQCKSEERRLLEVDPAKGIRLWGVEIEYPKAPAVCPNGNAQDYPVFPMPIALLEDIRNDGEGLFARVIVDGLHDGMPQPLPGDIDEARVLEADSRTAHADPDRWPVTIFIHLGMLISDVERAVLLKRSIHRDRLPPETSPPPALTVKSQLRMAHELLNEAVRRSSLIGLGQSLCHLPGSINEGGLLLPAAKLSELDVDDSANRHEEDDSEPDRMLWYRVPDQLHDDLRQDQYREAQEER